MIDSTRSSSDDAKIVEGEGILQSLYDGEEAQGFDLATGTEWIYPTNYPIRNYQKNIVNNALFKNTLVCLPTGLGKTFIAAVVMYNYHRWYPKHLIVFMAHSKPLVAQQVSACCNIMGIPSSLIAELNGNMLHSNRKKQWESKKIFFLTPQVFNNDLARGNVKAENIRCIVIDEAHKALGNQAYCQVIRSIKPFNCHFRVLALSATPGDDMNMVKEVVQNLMISHLELRNEEDPDIKPYLHEKKIETIVVKLDDQILKIKEKFLMAVDKYVKPLVMNKLLPQSFSSINSFTLVLKQRQFIQDSNIKSELRGLMLSNFSVAISLFHALEELMIYGMRSFVTKLKCLQSGEGATNKVHHRIGNDSDIISLIEYVEGILGPDLNVSFDANLSLTRLFDEIDNIKVPEKVVYSHPKFAALEKVIKEHFDSYKDSTRVIVFCKSRQCTGEICNFLARFRPSVKPMIFIGQSNSSSGIVSKGFNQAAQLTVMKKFRDGVYNTLIATCVAEEGLDIGEVDLIVNFDSGKNSNTQVQRSGRTGRKRDGRVVNLVTDGKEHQNYNISVSKRKRMSKKLNTDATKLPFYIGNPRLIPKGINPVCQEMYLSVKKDTGKEEEQQGKKKGNEKRKMTASKKLLDSPAEAKRKKLKESNDTKEQSNWGGSVHSQKQCDIRDCVKYMNGEIEILGEEDRPTMLLYNDDVKTPEEKPWMSLSDDELEPEVKNLVVEFLKRNDSTLKPRNNFKKLLNLWKFKDYLVLIKHKTDVISNLRAVEGCSLSGGDVTCLSQDDLDVQSLVTRLSEARLGIVRNEGSGLRLNSSLSSNKENQPPQCTEAIVDDFDPSDFLQPFDDFFTAPCNVVSSTPVRPSEKEDKSKQFKFLDPNPQNLEETSRGKKDRSSYKEDSSKTISSLLSITQALNIVRDNDAKKEIEPPSPASPVLFFSQKPRSSAIKCATGSPILSQKVTSRRPSRKCLSFKESPKVQRSRADDGNDDGECSDLFAETEIALQNHLLELEENLKCVQPPSKHENLDLDENTIEYDLADVNFDRDITLSSIIKKSKTSATGTSAKKVEDESFTAGFSGLFRRFDSVVKTENKNCSEQRTGVVEPPRMQPAVEAGPKTAVVRPLGYETLVANASGKQDNAKKPRSDQSSFLCDFSLFEEGDFDEKWFPTDRKQKHEETTAVQKDESEIAKVEDESSNDSDLFVNKQTKKGTGKNAEVDLFHFSDDADLSDGALEAIKAVEIYEKDVEIATKFAGSDLTSNVDSDDSEDLFMPAKNQSRRETMSELTKPGKPRVNKPEKARVRVFIEDEARISEGEKVSSDEENTSGLDEYDSSFVDEREVLTQAQGVDMTAKYLQSTKSPRVALPGAFKIPAPKPEEELNVFSQIGSEGESEYENDSFCVSEEENSEIKEISELELAEIVLQGKRKRNIPVESPATERKQKKKLKRVFRIESDSSDDEVTEVKQATETGRESIEVEEVKVVDIEPRGARCAEPVLFVGSRQIASAPDITTCLRAKWSVTVHVRSAPEADYIVSWRVGANRVLLSDFASGSPAASNSVKESIQRLSWNFLNPVLIVEDDKIKGLPRTVGRQSMWARHSCRRLVKAIQSNVKVIFSRSKDESARILVMLCRNEMINGHGINLATEIDPETERKMKFFCSLPGINVANAFRISNKFRSLASFFNCCDSVNRIMRELGLKKDAAVNAYQLLFTSPP